MFSKIASSKAKLAPLWSPVSLCAAIRETFSKPYAWPQLKMDLISGLIVGLVALPLGMALAIAIGVAPQYGLYTIVVAGALTSLLGGSRFQITGPTAAFVVILAPIVAQYGLPGLFLAGALSGLILMLMALFKMGEMIQFIPYPVTTGFTAGIATVIATMQLKDFFGLTFSHVPETYWQRLHELWISSSSLSLVETTVAAVTFLGLLIVPRFIKQIPSPILVLFFVPLSIFVLQASGYDIPVKTIGNQFTSMVHGVEVRGIPRALPEFHLPWTLTQKPLWSFEFLQNIFKSSLVIALLAAIESLLSAVVADGMSKTRHDPNAELFALGVGNLLAPFWGGIPATGAIARTATNIRYGAYSPISGLVHSLFVFLVLLIFAPIVSYLPIASLSALLLIVAYNMSDLPHVKHILKTAPASDIFVFVSCFSLTVAFDMVIGVSVGVGLATFLFMKRMSDLTETVLLSESESFDDVTSVEHLTYRVQGPLFFGAAQKAMGSLFVVSSQVKAVTLDLQDVPTMDVTGLVALESAIERLLQKKVKVKLIGLRAQPYELLKKSEILKQLNLLKF